MLSWRIHFENRRKNETNYGLETDWCKRKREKNGNTYKKIDAKPWQGKNNNFCSEKWKRLEHPRHNVLQRKLLTFLKEIHNNIATMYRWPSLFAFLLKWVKTKGNNLIFCLKSHKYDIWESESLGNKTDFNNGGNLYSNKSNNSWYSF